jgi:hypothetical protein
MDYTGEALICAAEPSDRPVAPTHSLRSVPTISPTSSSVGKSSDIPDLLYVKSPTRRAVGQFEIYCFFTIRNASPAFPSVIAL